MGKPKTLPRTITILRNYFGIVLVLLGSGVEAVTTNPTLANDGWIVVTVSIFVWVFGKAWNPKKH